MSIMLLNDSASRVLSLYTRDYFGRLHGREIARELEMNQKTVSNVLSGLEAEGVLRSMTEGRNRLYSLDFRNLAIRHVLSMVEAEKAVGFVGSSALGSGFVEKLLASGSPMVVIFGSYAAGTQRKDSDLDLLVLSPFKASLSEVERFYGVEASVKEYSKGEFALALAEGDKFIKEVLRNHVILVGAEFFVRSVLDAASE